MTFLFTFWSVGSLYLFYLLRFVIRRRYQRWGNAQSTTHGWFHPSTTDFTVDNAMNVRPTNRDVLRKNNLNVEEYLNREAEIVSLILCGLVGCLGLCYTILYSALAANGEGIFVAICLSLLALFVNFCNWQFFISIADEIADIYNKSFSDAMACIAYQNNPFVLSSVKSLRTKSRLYVVLITFVSINLLCALWIVVLSIDSSFVVDKHIWSKYYIWFLVSVLGAPAVMTPFSISPMVLNFYRHKKFKEKESKKKYGLARLDEVENDLKNQ